MLNPALAAGGWLDEDGWPLAIPPGKVAVGTIWAWTGSAEDPALAQSRAGTYVLRHEGEGKLSLGGDVEILSQRPGEIVFRNLSGGTMRLDITATDPNHDGNHIRDITIVRQEYQALFDMGAIFNPDWLALIEDARVLRFKDWMKTDWATSSDLAAQADPANPSYMAHGAPVEIMVALANQVGADPWFTMPAGASEAYIRDFATYVRDHLDPGLKVHVEYSNEMWNWGYGQTSWLLEQAGTAWATTDAARWLDYQVMLAARSALIWDEVFGAQAPARLDKVLGTQAGYFWLTERLLTAPLWREKDPEGYVAPSDVFDSLAIATYLGGATLSDAQMRADLLAQVRADPVAAAAWLTGKLMDPDYKQSVPQMVTWWQGNRAIADRYGLDLVSYEGGQHILHGWLVQGMSEAEQALLTGFLSDYMRSPEIADLYAASWAEWARLSDGPFMQFVEIDQPSKWGAWGLYTSLGDHSPRSDLLEHLNATQASWFGTGGGPQYQQGAIRFAGEGGEALLGTDRDDFLIGGRGNDRFTPGRGQDAIAGEGGRDILLLTGTPTDYTATRDGDMVRIT
ncbi:hypothetical protein, partial [Stagnihabitans tardus]